MLGLVKAKSAALHVGSTIHSAFRFWNMSRWKNEQPTLKQLHDVYSSQWTDHQQAEPVEWEDDQDEQKQTGWKLLETYFRESPIPANEKPEAVEVNVEADLKQHGLPKLVGILDLVRRVDGLWISRVPGKLPILNRWPTRWIPRLRHIHCCTVKPRERKNPP